MKQSRQYCKNLKKPKTRKEQMAQRVEIAKDVMLMVASKRLMPKNGYYLSNADQAFYDQLVNRWETPTDEALERKLKAPDTASVCAIGAVFVATLDKYDELTVGDLVNPSERPEDNDMVRYLAPWFSHEELRVMESAFEECDWDDDELWCKRDNPEREEYREYWCWKFKRQAVLRKKKDEHDADAGMMAIMRHIVRNKGLITFMPKKLAPKPPPLRRKSYKAA